MQTSQENFDQHMGQLDDRIKKIKATLADDPYNKEQEKKLQNMYRAQALSKVLENRIVNQESASAGEVPTSVSN